MTDRHTRESLRQWEIVDLLVLVLERIELLNERLDTIETTLKEGFSAMALQVSDILADIATLSTAVDGLIAAQPAPQDLQPVHDALTALQVKVATATPVAPTAGATTAA